VGGRTPAKQQTSGNYVPILVLMGASLVLAWAAIRRPPILGGAHEPLSTMRDNDAWQAGYQEAYGAGFPG
jgi:hypothetical protein